MHDHSQSSHGVINGVINHANMESLPGAADAPLELQFIDTMIAHRQGAVDMASLANTRTRRAEMRKLTQGIITEQRREITEMQALRAKWFANMSPGINMDFPGMRTGMAGMDTVKLASLKGNEFDVEFINQMIAHHEGAIEMAKALKADENYAELQRLAGSIVASQSAEIEQMRGWIGSVVGNGEMIN